MKPALSKRLTKAKKTATRPADGYETWKDSGVWMVEGNSAVRALAEDMMAATNLMGQHDDWRTRDKIITAISPRLEGMLDWVAGRSHK